MPAGRLAGHAPLSTSCQACQARNAIFDGRKPSRSNDGGENQIDIIATDHLNEAGRSFVDFEAESQEFG